QRSPHPATMTSPRCASTSLPRGKHPFPAASWVSERFNGPEPCTSVSPVIHGGAAFVRYEAGAMQGSRAARVGSRRHRLCTGWLGHQAQLDEERDLVIVEVPADDPAGRVEVPHLAQRQPELLAGGGEWSQRRRPRPW